MTKTTDAVDAQKKDNDDWQYTWWIDCATKLPIRLDITYRSSRAMANAIDCCVSDIVFDAPLDPALFSTDPPEGYTELAKPPAKDDQGKSK